MLSHQELKVDVLSMRAGLKAFAAMRTHTFFLCGTKSIYMGRTIRNSSFQAISAIQIEAEQVTLGGGLATLKHVT